MVERGLGASANNVKLSAVRKLIQEARCVGAVAIEDATCTTDIPNERQSDARHGNRLTRGQAKELLTVPDRSTLKRKRDYATLHF